MFCFVVVGGMRGGVYEWRCVRILLQNENAGNWDVTDCFVSVL